MMGFQLLFILLVFILTLREIQGSEEEDDLYEHFNKLSKPDSDDENIFWTDEGPTYEAPPQALPPQALPPQALPPQAPPPPIILSLDEISHKLVNYYRAEELKWSELKDSRVNANEWNKFCGTLWKKWKSQPILNPDCLHLKYFEPPIAYKGIIVIAYGGFRVTGNLLECNCWNSEDKNITEEQRLTYFHVMRGNSGEYFILQREYQNSRSRTLFPVYYIHKVDNEPQ